MNRFYRLLLIGNFIYSVSGNSSSSSGNPSSKFLYVHKYCNHVLIFCVFIVVARRKFQHPPLIQITAEGSARIIILANKQGVDEKLLVQLSQEFQRKITELQNPTIGQPQLPFIGLIVAAEANARVIKLASKEGVDHNLLVQLSQDFQRQISQLPSNVQPQLHVQLSSVANTQSTSSANTQSSTSTIAPIPSPTIPIPSPVAITSKGNKNHCIKCGGEIYCIRCISST